MFPKHEFEMEMFMTVCRSPGKWCISNVRNTILLADHTGVKVWILTQPYKSTPSFVEIFSGLKGRLVYVAIYGNNCYIQACGCKKNKTDKKILFISFIE